MIFVGPAGCGKTQYAKALATHKGWNMLITSHIEGLKNLTSEHDAIFLDDMSIEGVDADKLLSLLESNDAREIRILYTTKRGGLVQIWAFNPKSFRNISNYFYRDEYARRCRIVQIPHDFIININVINNYNTNIHTNIFNNTEEIEANKQALREIETSTD